VTKSFDESEAIKLTDITSFSLLFWLLTINCMIIYGAYFAFTDNANDI